MLVFQPPQKNRTPAKVLCKLLYLQACGVADLNERRNLLASLSGRGLETEREGMMSDSILLSGLLNREREGGEEEGGREGRGEGEGEREGGGEEEREREGEGKEKEDISVEVVGQKQCNTVEVVHTEKHLKSDPIRASEGGRCSPSQDSSPSNVSPSHVELPPSPRSPAPPPASGYQGAVLTLQAALRGYLCRKRLRLYVAKHHAATIIQAAW